MAFGKPIGEFGQTQKAIAESYAELMAGEVSLILMRYLFIFFWRTFILMLHWVGALQAASTCTTWHDNWT